MQGRSRCYPLRDGHPPSFEPAPLAAASLQPRAVWAPGNLLPWRSPESDRTPLLALSLALAIFAEPDLEEHETSRRHEAESDQHDRERLTCPATDHCGGPCAGHHQQPGRTER